MSDVEALSNFARFQAAAVLQAGSSTDFGDLDAISAQELKAMAEIAAGGSTDPHSARQLLELQLLPVAVGLSVAVRHSPTPATETVASEPTPDEAPPSDFELLDELRTPEAQICRQIRALRGASRLLYRERLARRLEFLLDALEEEGELLAQDSSESLREMLFFLEAVPEFRYPTVTVTPFGTFRAQWRADPTSHFAVDFMPDGQVRFVVFAPDPRYPNRVQRVSGIVSSESVMEIVHPYKVHRWAADAGT